MAVILITSITPNIGPAVGGNMLTVIGSGFRLPDPPPPTGIVPVPPPTVLVEFGGIASEPQVVSSTKLYVIAPKHSLIDASNIVLISKLVDIRFENLDNASVPIGGEGVTVPNAYTYNRLDVSGENESDFARLVRRFLDLLTSETINNVVHDTNTDYDDDLSTPQPAHSSLPGISVIGPDIVNNRFLTQEILVDSTPFTNPVDHLQARVAKVVNLVFDIVIYSDNPVEHLNLMNLLTDWVDRSPYLTMPIDPGAPSGGDFCYEFEFVEGGEFTANKQAGIALNSNLIVSRGQVQIVGFQFNGLPGVPLDRAVSVSSEVAEDGLVVQNSWQAGDVTIDLARSLRSPPPAGGNC